MSEEVLDTPAAVAATNDIINVNDDDHEPSRSYRLTPTTDPKANWSLVNVKNSAIPLSGIEVDFWKDSSGKVPKQDQCTLQIKLASNNWEFTGAGFQYCDGKTDTAGDIAHAVVDHGNELILIIKYQASEETGIQFKCKNLTDNKTYYSPDPGIIVKRRPL